MCLFYKLYFFKFEKYDSIQLKLHTYSIAVSIDKKKRGHTVRRKALRTFTGFTVLLCILLLLVFPVKAGEMPSERNLQHIGNIIEMIGRKYNGDISEEQLLEGALKGMFGQMDPYTIYYTVEEASDFFGNIEGTYEGIGVSIEQAGEFIIVSKIFTLSPAEEAGIRVRDVIVSVDGESVVGFSATQVSSLIRGLSGTKVRLGIIRGTTTEVKYIEVERREIKISPLTLEIRNDIGYIKLEMFSANTEEFITKALEELDSKKISKVILDLRDNPGGQVDQAVFLARKFIPKGLITRLVFKDEALDAEEYYSYLEKSKYELIVLVNDYSASASEIVAGAVQDREAGIVIGEKTFGKAKVQNLIPLLTPQASEKYKERFGKWFVDAYELSVECNINPSQEEIMGWVKMTTGAYYTPNDRLIQGQGIIPDIIVENPIEVNNINIRSIQKLPATWKPDLGDEGIDIYNAEKILKLIGYDVDEPDTVLDEKTFQAINDFRVDMELYPGGVLDFTTQKRLNMELDKKILEIDKQYAKAVEVLMRHK